MMLVTMPSREMGLASVSHEGESVPKNPSIQKLKTSSSHSIHTNGSNNQLASNQNSITRQNSANNSFAGEQLAQEIAVGRRCCTENSRKVAAGIVMTALIALSWVGAAHCLKQTYNRPRNRTRLVEDTTADNSTETEFIPFDAPFFTTWLCTAFNVLFLPVFLIGRQCWSRGTTCRVIIDTLQRFQEKQLSFSQFFARCGLFTVMWIVTNLLLVFGLRLLDTTDVLALYSAHVAFVYLLSWVILHQQFVGVRIVAIILVNTGVALLAYMDGVSGTTTLVGVVLSATAAGLSGVYKVTFKKLIGDVTFGQLAMFFSLIGFLNIVLLWPLVLCSYLLNLENLVWEHMPWGLLFGAGALSLTANLLGNLGIACTFEMFLTLGLAFAVPISAIVDIYMYEVVFQGMKLAGILLILLGFMLVQLPDDWPDYLTMLLRYRLVYASENSPLGKTKVWSIFAPGHDDDDESGCDGNQFFVPAPRLPVTIEILSRLLTRRCFLSLSSVAVPSVGHSRTIFRDPILIDRVSQLTGSHSFSPLKVQFYLLKTHRHALYTLVSAWN